MTYESINYEQPHLIGATPGSAVFRIAGAQPSFLVRYYGDIPGAPVPTVREWARETVIGECHALLVVPTSERAQSARLHEMFAYRLASALNLQSGCVRHLDDPGPEDCFHSDAHRISAEISHLMAPLEQHDLALGAAFVRPESGTTIVRGHELSAAHIPVDANEPVAWASDFGTATRHNCHSHLASTSDRLDTSFDVGDQLWMIGGRAPGCIEEHDSMVRALRSGNDPTGYFTQWFRQVCQRRPQQETSTISAVLVERVR